MNTNNQSTQNAPVQQIINAGTPQYSTPSPPAQNPPQLGIYTENGSLDWTAVKNLSFFLYENNSEPKPRRPVVPLLEEARHRLVPNALDFETHKYLKLVFPISSRCRQNAIHKTCISYVMEQSLKLLTLVVNSNKRPSNKTILYELDETHEGLRRLWFVLYELGFFGERKNGRIYDTYGGLSDFARINQSLDTIGRLIGSKKKHLNH